VTCPNRLCGLAGHACSDLQGGGRGFESLSAHGESPGELSFSWLFAVGVDREVRLRSVCAIEIFVPRTHDLPRRAGSEARASAYGSESPLQVRGRSRRCPRRRSSYRACRRAHATVGRSGGAHIAGSAREVSGFNVGVMCALPTSRIVQDRGICPHPNPGEHVLGERSAALGRADADRQRGDAQGVP
jgi:hypothetical protein